MSVSEKNIKLNTIMNYLVDVRMIKMQYGFQDDVVKNT